MARNFWFLSAKLSESTEKTPAKASKFVKIWEGFGVARLTGLEPATPGVTGRYSNQLSYNRAIQHLTLSGVRRVLGLSLRCVKR